MRILLERKNLTEKVKMLAQSQVQDAALEHHYCLQYAYFGTSDLQHETDKM